MGHLVMVGSTAKTFVLSGLREFIRWLKPVS